jgi:hypothetical protein
MWLIHAKNPTPHAAAAQEGIQNTGKQREGSYRTQAANM